MERASVLDITGPNFFNGRHALKPASWHSLRFSSYRISVRCLFYLRRFEGWVLVRLSTDVHPSRNLLCPVGLWPFGPCNCYRTALVLHHASGDGEPGPRWFHCRRGQRLCFSRSNEINCTPKKNIPEVLETTGLELQAVGAVVVGGAGLDGAVWLDG